MEKKGLFHNLYYKDYERKIVLDHKTLRSHIEYVYAGKYYTVETGDRKWIVDKIIYFLVTCFALFLFVCSMTIKTTLNHVRHIIMLQSICLLLCLLLFVCAVSRLAASKRMTGGAFKLSVISYREFAALIVFLSFMILLCQIRFAMMESNLWSSLEMLQISIQFVFTAVLFCLYRQIKKEHYLIEQSKDLPMGIDITNDFANY